MARPLTKIDWELFDKLCEFQCTLREIAYAFNCTDDTIHNACKREKGMGFSEYYEQKATIGRNSLRRKQYELAMAGDRVMLIWLGKQYLKQSEKVEQTSKVSFEHVSDEELDKKIAELIKEKK